MNDIPLCEIGARYAPNVGSWAGVRPAFREPFCFGGGVPAGDRKSAAGRLTSGRQARRG